MAEEKLKLWNKRNCFVAEDRTAGTIAARVAGFAVAAVLTLVLVTTASSLPT